MKALRAGNRVKRAPQTSCLGGPLQTLDQEKRRQGEMPTEVTFAPLCERLAKSRHALCNLHLLPQPCVWPRMRSSDDLHSLSCTAKVCHSWQAVLYVLCLTQAESEGRQTRPEGLLTRSQRLPSSSPAGLHFPGYWLCWLHPFRTTVLLHAV